MKKKRERVAATSQNSMAVGMIFTRDAPTGCKLASAGLFRTKHVCTIRAGSGRPGGNIMVLVAPAVGWRHLLKSARARYGWDTLKSGGGAIAVWLS